MDYTHPCETLYRLCHADRDHVCHQCLPWHSDLKLEDFLIFVLFPRLVQNAHSCHQQGQRPPHLSPLPPQNDSKDSHRYDDLGSVRLCPPSLPTADSFGTQLRGNALSRLSVILLGSSHLVHHTADMRWPGLALCVNSTGFIRPSLNAKHF